jgi:outer membrane protein assembly factor BamB
VQQEPIPGPSTYPLPTEYWARPIEGQNTNWWTIASNWLGSPQINVGAGNFQPDGIAPNSPHIMWTKPIQFGGVIGGTNVGTEGDVFYTGMSYNQRFTNPIIMYGRLYYNEPYGNSGSGGDYVCVDLRTGQEIWRTNTTGIGVPSFGYLYSFDNPNQHGVLPNGLLFTSNFARSYDPTTGIPTTMNITNVPSGTAVLGPSGEHLRYAITNIGNATKPNWRLTQWNSSNVVGAASGNGISGWYSGTANASLASCYDWNVSISVSFTTSPTIVSVFLDDVLLGRNGSLPSLTSQTPYTMWAISLKPESRGALLWMKNYDAPPGNDTVIQRTVDPTTRVFTMYLFGSMQWYGYSLDNGSLLWGPVVGLRDFDVYAGSVTTTNTGSWTEAYGNLYVSGYGGLLYCIDSATGKMRWVYGNGGPGNSTNSGLTTPWGNRPIFIGAIADGKVYLFSSEHSPNTPLYKDTLIRCINATTGEEIWTLMGWGSSGSFVNGNGVVADGYYAYFNAYDGQVYCVGKGPSATTVEAPMAAITAGNSLVIRGAVTDIAAGTKQDAQAARFPNGVPAVSDASMSEWMEYVYMQKPCPTNAVGVDVTLDAVDPNGNFIHLGTATSDTSSLFSYAWTTPDIPGKYTIIATFAGSEGYWSSYAETAMVVQEAPPSPTPTPAAAPLPPFALYILIATVIIVIAIAIVGIMIVRVLGKRP